jgi:glutathione S-transferase
VTSKPEITGFKWVPPFAQGLVRDTRPRWAFEELGIDYDVRLLELGENKQAAHRALQPFGQVPTLTHGDVELFESGAIVLYIARLKSGLLPGDTAGDARATAWLISALNSVEPMIFDLIMVNLFDRDEAYADLARPKMEQRLHDRLDDLAKALGDKEWLDGGGFTVGDLLMVSALRALRGTAVIEQHPKLAAYVARGEARPAFKKALADHIAAFEGATPPAWFTQGEKQ